MNLLLTLPENIQSPVETSGGGEGKVGEKGVREGKKEIEGEK